MHSTALIRTTAVVLALGALAACSSTPKPTEQMAVSRTTVNRVAAEPEVASNAPVDIQKARDKLMRADKAMADKDYKLARELAAQAEVDAKLAQSKANSAKAQAAANALQDDIRVLRTELERNN